MIAANCSLSYAYVAPTSDHGAVDGRRSENKNCYTERTGADPDEGPDPQSRVEKEKNDNER